MGYLINTEFITKTVTIPESNAQIMDITPYQILAYSGFAQCLSVTLTGEPVQTPYTGFDHLYLMDNLSGTIIGIYDEVANAQGISTGYCNFMMLNMKHPPNAFGAVIKEGNSGISLKFNLPISTGTGNIYVNFTYRILQF